MGISQWADTAKNVVGGIQNALATPPNFRAASGITNRDQQVMTWRLPNGSSVQMYINPENFVVAESKQITQTRTKGGFLVQYWGDNLTKLTLSGTTGSSGIKGIKVLEDVYRAENRGFELVAATQAQTLQQTIDTSSLGDTSVSKIFDAVSDRIRERNFLLRPSLASLALSILLFYQGIQYRGFFTEFTVTESVGKLGLFDYTLNFVVTEKRGSRDNFMAWHKEPLADKAGAQLLSGLLGTAGNAARSFFGLPGQLKTTPQFHPENAPMSFGGTELGSDPLLAAVNMF